jgi:hypothetical protein
MSNGVDLQAGKIRRPISILVQMTFIPVLAWRGNDWRFHSALCLVTVSFQMF